MMISDVLQSTKAKKDVSQEPDVKMYMDFETKDVRNFRISHITSPYHFITEFDIPQKRLGYPDTWHNEMQECYNSPMASQRYRLDLAKLKIFRCYACLDPINQTWERVRVLSLRKETLKADVFFYELSEFREVGIDGLLELDNRFCTWASQAFRTHLPHIQPIGGGVIWPREAVEYFKKLVREQGNSYRTVIMSRSEESLPYMPCKMINIGVCMIARNPTRGHTLQADMVLGGFAEPAGLCSGYQEMVMLPGLEPVFSLDAFLKIDAADLDSEGGPFSREIPTKDEVMTRVGPTDEDNDSVTSKTDITLVVEQLEIRRPTAIPTLKNSRLGDVLREEDHLPFFFQKRLGFLRFSHMDGPGSIFVQMASKFTQLMEMQAALGATADNLLQIPYTECRHGLSVACQFLSAAHQKTVWVRAVVKQTLCSVKIFKVVLVDYGNEVAVKFAFCRYLPEYFKKIPSFCHRVHIASRGVGPAVGKQWTAETAEGFRRYLNCWEDEWPLYYGCPSANRGLVKLEDYNQEVEYDILNDKWLTGGLALPPLDKGNPNEHINKRKEEPMLASLYNSFGVEVAYEVIVPTQKFQFDSLTGMLAQAGFASRVARKVDQEQAHECMVNLFKCNKVLQRQREINDGTTTDLSFEANFKIYNWLDAANALYGFIGRPPDTDEESDDDIDSSDSGSDTEAASGYMS